MSMLEPDVQSSASRTKQSMREECDINAIVAKARRGQAVAHLSQGVPTYGDFSDVGDYKSALDRLRAADEWFRHLPAKVRGAFHNDPGEFLEVQDTPEGRAVLEAAGLYVPPKAEPAPSPEPARPA